MANIKLQKVFKNAFPLEESKIVTQYYHLTRRKNSRKYFDEFDKIWEQKWLAICALQLDKVDRLNMLDIGAGPGIFAWMCVSLGHLVDITELPFDTEIIENDNLHYFEDLKTSYELDKTVNTYRWEITKETDEFPIEKQYDLITIQRSNFDIGWEEKNYLKFINLCFDGIVSNGRIFWMCAKEQSDTLEMACKKADISHIRYPKSRIGKGKLGIFEIYK